MVEADSPLACIRCASATQPVDADDNNRAAFAGVVQQSGQAGSLFARRGARQLVAIDPCTVHARCVERIDLLIERLVSGADSWGINRLC
jgi:hypothetical protein